MKRQAEVTSTDYDGLLRRIKTLRKHHKQKQAAVGDALGITGSTYSRKERGLIPFSVPEVQAIGRLFGEPLIFLGTEENSTAIEFAAICKTAIDDGNEQAVKVLIGGLKVLAPMHPDPEPRDQRERGDPKIVNGLG
jgi:transcriptional regulator with XRE-family HTH domain